MAHKVTFSATSGCGNMLQVFESDSKICDIVARILHVTLKIVSCNIALPTVVSTRMCQLPRVA